jgi:hypothetical protein
MKPQPQPEFPGETPAERMSNALRMVLTVPKDVRVKEEAKRNASATANVQRKTSLNFAAAEIPPNRTV